MTADSTRRLTALSLMLIGGCGFAAIWILAARLLQTQAAWLAPVAALDIALMVRLARMPAGWLRAACCASATLAVILLANWGIAATEIGRSMGLLPWESALRLGTSYARELIRLANGPAALAWYALALVVATISGLSGRRPAP